jgi:hypothetical protein
MISEPHTSSYTARHSLVISSETFDFIRSWIISNFPIDLETYASNRLVIDLSLRIAESLLPIRFTNKEANTGGPTHLVLPVLESLPVILEQLPPSYSGDIDDEVHENVVSRPKKKASQRVQKLAKKSMRRLTGIDPTPFRSLGVPVPNSRTEVHELATEILSSQKAELKVSSPHSVTSLRCL